MTSVVVISSQAQAQQYVYYQQAANQQNYYYVQQPAAPYYQASNVPRYYQYSQAAAQYSQPASLPQYYQSPQYNQSAPFMQTTVENTQFVPTSNPVSVAAAPASQPAQAAGYGDPYGFLSWLNATRASYGLGSVGYDQNLSNWAAMNNNQQMARGLGHFVMGPARRQNSAMGGGFPGAMWMASPAHQAALLDPTISWIGIAAAGAYWTFNAY
jgi:hypothetical protein